jgi:hypothetical protein
MSSRVIGFQITRLGAISDAGLVAGLRGVERLVQGVGG